MIYAKWDVSLADRPEYTVVSLGALGLVGAALGYCREYETDGVVPFGASLLHRPGATEAIEELVQTGEVSRSETGFIFHEYLRSNETRSQIGKARKAAKRRQNKHRKQQHLSRCDKRVLNAFVPHSHSHSIKRDQDPEIQRDQGEVQEGGQPLVADPDPEPTREDAYRGAYEAGVTAGKGSGYGMPRNQAGELHQAILVHAKGGRTGKPLRGDRLLEWIRVMAEEFATWLREQAEKNPDAVGWYSGYGPRGFLKWLNEQG